MFSLDPMHAGYEVSYSYFHDFGTLSFNPNINESICDWGAVHTALPNATKLSIHVHHNRVRNMKSFMLGGFGPYFDYASTGVVFEQNEVSDTGSAPLYFNSDGQTPLKPGTWNVVRDNILVADHAITADYDFSLIYRSLAKVGNFTRNILAVRSTNQILMNCNCAKSTNCAEQFPSSSRFWWNSNLYTGPYLNGTFCGNMSQTTWQRVLRHDTASLFGVDPGFQDPASGDFSLRPSSPAITTLHFRNFSLATIGPRRPPAGRTVLVQARE